MAAADSRPAAWRAAAPGGTARRSSKCRTPTPAALSLQQHEATNVAPKQPNSYQWRVTRTLVRQPQPAVPPELTGRSFPRKGSARSAPCPDALPAVPPFVIVSGAAAHPKLLQAMPVLPLPPCRSPPAMLPALPPKAPSAALATRSAAKLSILLGDPPSRGTSAAAVCTALPPLTLPPLGPPRHGEAPTTGWRLAIVCFSLRSAEQMEGDVQSSERGRGRAE